MPLRIALTADPELPVPPIHYGGIERIIDMLARGLSDRGHELTVFAHPSSATAGKLVAWPGASSQSVIDTLRNAATLTTQVLANQFDVVHSFSRIAYLAPILPFNLPKLMTYQRTISYNSVRQGVALSRGTLWFSAISSAMMQDVAALGTWRLVFNGVPLSSYKFCADPGVNAPAVYLGRIEQIKGPHLAIEAARRAKIPLIIAGNIPEEHLRWYQTNVEPQINGRDVVYVGPVNDAEKNELLGHARVLLMPILWEEPFGIVMAEAMACGTPVVAFRRGSVPEVIEHGVTGFVVEDLDSMVAAIGNIDNIPRQACRDRVERLFSESAVVDAYLAVYTEMIAASSRRDG
jgi:glycosyltransferase involved in cell wall biosynthesis